MTKKQRAMWEQFNRSDKRYLSEVYGRWSSAKQAAYNHCMELAMSLDAIRCRICSANTCSFTFAFSYPDPQTGVLRLQFHTSRNVYDFEISEEVNA